MVNTDIKVEPSVYAKYELGIVEKHFPNDYNVIKSLIQKIGSNPYDVINRKEYEIRKRRLHKLESKESFKELEGFYSLDITNKYRLIWNILYDSNDNDQNINHINTSEKIRIELWKDIDKESNNSKADRFIYIYLLNVFFNDHNDLNPNIAMCSIDYLLQQKGIEIDPYSPFMNTKYSVLKYDEYQKRIEEGDTDFIDDSAKKSTHTNIRYPFLTGLMNYRARHKELF